MVRFLSFYIIIQCYLSILGHALSTVIHFLTHIFIYHLYSPPLLAITFILAHTLTFYFHPLLPLSHISSTYTLTFICSPHSHTFLLTPFFPPHSHHTDTSMTFILPVQNFWFWYTSIHTFAILALVHYDLVTYSIPILTSYIYPCL